MVDEAVRLLFHKITDMAESLTEILRTGGGLTEVQKLLQASQPMDRFKVMQVVMSVPGRIDLVEWLLADTEPSLLTDSTDSDGNTALHIACKSNNLDYVSFLLSRGANPSALNKAGQLPKDLTGDADIVRFLEADKVTNNLQNARLEYLRNIESDLPDNIMELKQVVLELLGQNHLFQERCKQKLRQLIHDKHAAVYKFHLLENAAGKREENGNYINQIQIQQQANEQQAANIAYLQIQSSMYEPALLKMDEFYKKNIIELSEQHGFTMKNVKDRLSEFERQVSNAKSGTVQHMTEITAKLDSFTNDTYPAISEDENQYFQKAQNENLESQKRLKHLQKDMTNLGDKLKNIQQMRSVVEKDLFKLRNDPTIHRKILQETVQQFSCKLVMFSPTNRLCRWQKYSTRRKPRATSKMRIRVRLYFYEEKMGRNK